MCFIVAGLTVEVSQYVYSNIDLGCCCAYMYVQHTNFEGGGEDSPTWPYVEKPWTWFLAMNNIHCTPRRKLKLEKLTASSVLVGGKFQK